MNKKEDETDSLTEILNVDEVVIATGWTEVPMPRQGLMTIAPIGSFIRLGYVVVNKKRAADLRKNSAAAGLSLDRHMGLVLTSQRLVTFRASRFPRRRREMIGEVASTEIASAVMPYVSWGSMKTVAIQLRSGLTVRFRVDDALGEALVERFNGPPSSE
jgi:hypothetical protein